MTCGRELEILLEGHFAGDKLGMKGLVIVLALLSVAPLSRAETWAEVNHGAFAIPRESVAQVKATLEDTIAAAIRAKGAKPPEWSSYLIQYRGAKVAHGLRAIEIHGSCSFDNAGFDPRSEFYDEGISDGGECFFLVYYVIKTGRYSNVLFHGKA